MEPWADADVQGAVRPLADRALHAADAYGTLPTPLDDVQAALTAQPTRDLFDIADLPRGLLDIARRLRGKILGALDLRQKVVYIDREQASPRHRFAQAHEIGHLAIPWHADAYFGDDHFSLEQTTSLGLEAEANAFAADLIFQGDRFLRAASDYRLGLDAPLALTEEWGASRHAAIRRYVEYNPRACGVLLIGRYVSQRDEGTAVKVIDSFESPTFRIRHGVLKNQVPLWLADKRSGIARDALALMRGDADEPVIAGSEIFVIRGEQRHFSYELTWTGWLTFALIFDRPRVQGFKRVKTLWVPK